MPRQREWAKMPTLDMIPCVYWHKRGSFYITRDIAAYIGASHWILLDHIENCPNLIGEPFSPIWKLFHPRNHYSYALDQHGLVVLLDLRLHHDDRHDPTHRLLRLARQFELSIAPTSTRPMSFLERVDKPAPMRPDGNTFRWLD